jgi:DNA-binding NarL/FixJ family response regulator
MEPELSPQVLIVDHDDAFRRSTAELLGALGYTTLQLDSGTEALSVVAAERPALVILDVELPGLNGYEICREVRDRYGDTIRIAFVSGERVESVDRSTGFLVGGDDYIVKPVEAGELAARVRRLLERPHVNGGGVTSPSRLFTSLTPRENEVLDLLAEGYRQDEIAEKLVISTKTVATHIQRVLTKLEVRSRAEAVGLALRTEHRDFTGHALV